MACVVLNGCHASRAVKKGSTPPQELAEFYHYLRHARAEPAEFSVQVAAAPRNRPAKRQVVALPVRPSPAALTSNGLFPPMVSPPPEPSPAELPLRGILAEFDESARFFEGVTAAEVRGRQQTETLARALLEERNDGIWFAAAVGTGSGQSPVIRRRFERAQDLAEFVREEPAIIETWAYTPEAHTPDPMLNGRRLTAPELAGIRSQESDRPTFAVLVYRDRESGTMRRDRLEFGLHAAKAGLAEQQAYRKHRQLQQMGRWILHARSGQGQLSAFAQWQNLTDTIRAGKFAVGHLPVKPAADGDFFVAIEYEVGLLNNFTQAVRFYRRPEMSKDVIDGVQFLHLQPQGESQWFQALGLQPGQTGGEMNAAPANPALVPAIHPIAGQDVVDMRVFDPAQADERCWNRLDFGEPHVVRQRGLASYGLLQGYLEQRQKALALRKSKLDLFAEPIILGLNIGGGYAGVAAPLGDGARLAYNLVVAPAFVQRVPNTRQYPELLLHLASRSVPDAQLDKFFGRGDIRFLTEELAGIDSPALADMLKTIDDADLKVMAKLSRGRSIDGRYRLLVDTLTGIGKVTGTTNSGALESIFDNSRLALNGDFGIKNTLAWGLKRKNLTPASGYSLEDLIKNKGPSSSWWQFIDLSVDVRAVFNSIFLRLNHARTDRELLRPIPHSPLVTDLAAYEVRGFGFPGLIFHKRKLLAQDARSYASDYAYSVIGTRIVEHFQEESGFVDEIKAGHIAPLGFVRTKEQDGTVSSSDFPVFGHQIAQGKYAGKTAIVMFGLKAFQSHFKFMERELDRFHSFEAALIEGGVIEMALADPAESLSSSNRLEPAIFAGEMAMSVRYHSLLHALLEYHRYRRLQEWGESPDPADSVALEVLTAKLRQLGVAVDKKESPLLGIDTHNSVFVYARQMGGKPQSVSVTLIPGMGAIDRELRKAEEKSLMESFRRNLLH